MRLIGLSIFLLLVSGGVAGAAIIERFDAVADCGFPDPRRGILSYAASGDVARARIDALHRGGRERTIYSALGSRGFASLGARGIPDPAPTDDVEAYRLIVTSFTGAVLTRRLDFRYRRAVFDLFPPVAHTRGGPDHYTRYQSSARVQNVDSITCSFKFTTLVEGESGRAGSADIAAGPTVRCDIAWRSVAKARAGGTVQWTARVTDRCTQGRITRTAPVNPIP
jgi:hypothetical protein